MGVFFQKLSNILKNVSKKWICFDRIVIGRSISALWSPLILDHMWAIDEFSHFLWTLTIGWFISLSFLGKCQNFTIAENVGD